MNATALRLLMAGVAATLGLACTAAAGTPSLTALFATPTDVSGGPGAGVVTLSGLAGTAGVSVSLASDNAILKVPASVTVQPLHIAADFVLRAGNTSTTVTAHVSATLGSVTKTAQVVVRPSGLSLLVVPDTISGGSTVRGGVALDGTAGPGGDVILLASDNADLVVGPSVTVAEGSVTAFFAVNAKPIAAQESATVTASFHNVIKTKTVSLVPADLAGLKIQSNTIVGGRAELGAIELSGNPGLTGVDVALSSDNSAVIVPTSVHVAGTAYATFVIKTRGVDAQVNATITAKFGTTTKTAALAVLKASLAIVGAEHNVFGGMNAGAYVSLNGAAGPSGAVVTLTSSNSAVLHVPASATIASQTAVKTFLFSTTGVSSDVLVTITATYSGTTKSTTVTVHPAILYAIVANPVIVVGGNSVTFKVVLAGQASAGGLDVALSSSDMAVISLPSTVHVAAGSSTATLVVATAKVSAPVLVTVKSALNLATRSVVVTVAP